MLEEEGSVRRGGRGRIKGRWQMSAASGMAGGVTQSISNEIVLSSSPDE